MSDFIVVFTVYANTFIIIAIFGISNTTAYT